MRKVIPVAAIVFSLLFVILVSGCKPLPRVLAEDRLFLNLSLEFLDSYQLPPQEFEQTTVGGLSSLNYDRQTSQLLALSDDRSNLAPARFYTLELNLAPSEASSIKIEEVKVTGVTFLQTLDGGTYPTGTVDTEGMAISPRNTLYVSSEGISNEGINPWIKEFDRTTGELQSELPIPNRFLPSQGMGIRDNMGFESLVIHGNSLASEDPFRLFTAPEQALAQDDLSRVRLLHYVINTGLGELLAEHLYLLEPDPGADTISNGLSELIALDQEGYFLSLERTFGLTGFGAKIFQFVVANATDTSRIESFHGGLGQVQPVQKKLLLDLSNLDLELDNLEGMTFGPRLPDGSQTLVLVSDNNFNSKQVTQFLLFRLTNN